MATPVIMPRQGQSVESCILVEWLVKPGDTVAEGTALANIETDKAVFEVEAPEAGTVLELFWAEGDDIPVLVNIAALGSDGEDAVALRPNGAADDAPAAAAADTPAPTAAAVPTATATAGAGISPRARKLASEKNIDASGIGGTGPGGRIIERDVATAAATLPKLSPAAQAAMGSGLTAPATGSGPGGLVLSGDLVAANAAPAANVGEPTEIPVTGIRKIIAQRMRDSLGTTAQLTMNRTFDATAVLAYRKRIKASAESMGLPSITLNDMVLYCVTKALKQHPAVNGHFLGDKIVQYPFVNLGIAIDTPRGLMVPVLKGIDTMSLADISRSVKPMAADAIAGSINPDLLAGGTFTVTNLGMLGIESFTPVLNAPEVAILGVGGLQVKAVMTDAGVQHVQAINLSLTIDHQAVDGAPGARFLQTLATMLENIDLTLAS